MTEVVGNLEVLFAAVLANAFCVLYHLRQPWWTTHVGQHIMTYSGVVAAVLDLSAVRILAGAGLDVEWFRALRLIVFTGVPIAVGWRILILMRVPRGRPARRKSREKV